MSEPVPHPSPDYPPKPPDWYGEPRGRVESEFRPLTEWQLYALSSASRESLEATLALYRDEPDSKTKPRRALHNLTFVDVARIHVERPRTGKFTASEDPKENVARARYLLANGGVRPRTLDFVSNNPLPRTRPLEPPRTAVVTIAELSPYHIWDEDPSIIGGLELISPQRLAPAPMPEAEHIALLPYAAEMKLPEELRDRWQAAEMRKKRDVLDLLITMFGSDLDLTTDDQEALTAALNEAKTLPEVESLYQRVVDRYLITPEQVLSSLELANILEELRDVGNYENHIEANLRMLAILPDLTEHISLKRFRQLVPVANALLSRFDQEVYELPLFEGLEQREGPFSVPIGKLNPQNRVHKLEVARFLDLKFSIKSTEFKRIASIYNAFHKNLGDAVLDQRGETNSRGDLTLLEEARTKDPVRLFQLAVGSGPIAQRYKRSSPELYERLRYEARCKLYLMGEMASIRRSYKERQALEDDDLLEDLWIGSDGVLSAAQTVPGDSSAEVYRELTLDGGGTVRVLNIDRDEKSLYSTIEKALRDGNPEDKSKRTDYRGRVLVVDTKDPALLKRETLDPDRNLVFFEIDRTGRLIPSDLTASQPEDHDVMFQIMETLIANGEKLANGPWRVHIAKYRPTAFYEGRSRSSMGNVRLGKFVIHLENIWTKQWSREEIVVFTPDLELKKSAKEYFREYLADHKKRYSRSRVMQTEPGSRRPFAEQVLSARYYPAMRKRRSLGLDS